MYKNKEEFWKGVYSFKEKKPRFSFGFYKWWEEIPGEFKPGVKENGRYARVAQPRTLGVSAKVSKAYRVVVRTIKNATSYEVVAMSESVKELERAENKRKASVALLPVHWQPPPETQKKYGNVVMRMLVDWGRSNTWYQRPPIIGIGFGFIGAAQRMQGTYHIRTFTAPNPDAPRGSAAYIDRLEGVSSKPMKMKIDASGLREPIKIKIAAKTKEDAEGFEVSTDGIQFFPSIVISHTDKSSDTDGFVQKNFYVRKSAKRFGRDFVPMLDSAGEGVGVTKATWKSIRARVVIASGSLKVELNVASWPDPNELAEAEALASQTESGMVVVIEGGGGSYGIDVLAEKMTDRYADMGGQALPKGGKYFNNGTGAGFGPGY